MLHYYILTKNKTRVLSYTLVYLYQMRIKPIVFKSSPEENNHDKQFVCIRALL